MLKNLTVGFCLFLLVACSPRGPELPSALPPLPSPTYPPGATETYAAILTGNAPQGIVTPSATLRPTQTAKASATTKPSETTPATATPPKPLASATRTPAPPPTSTAAGVVDTQVPSDTAPAPADTATDEPPAATQEPTQLPAGITLVSLTSPINHGANATLVIRTGAGADCFLTYTAPSGTVSGAQGLGATTANGDGRCSWTWKIGTNTNPGTGHLDVSSNGQSARFDIEIQ